VNSPAASAGSRSRSSAHLLPDGSVAAAHIESLGSVALGIMLDSQSRLNTTRTDHSAPVLRLTQRPVLFVFADFLHRVGEESGTDPMNFAGRATTSGFCVVSRTVRTHRAAPPALMAVNSRSRRACETQPVNVNPISKEAELQGHAPLAPVVIGA